MPGFRTLTRFLLHPECAAFFQAFNQDDDFECNNVVFDWSCNPRYLDVNMYCKENRVQVRLSQYIILYIMNWSLSKSVFMYICMYIYVCICVCIYVCKHAQMALANQMTLGIQVRSFNLSAGTSQYYLLAYALFHAQHIIVFNPTLNACNYLRFSNTSTRFCNVQGKWLFA